MKSLYESIIKSNNAGALSFLRDIIKDPIGKEDKLNELWKSYDLAFDLGDGEGYWGELSDHKRVFYYVPYIENNKIEEEILAFIGQEYAAGIVIKYHSLKKKTLVKKWAEKICRMLHMSMHIEKNWIYLNFSS